MRPTDKNMCGGLGTGDAVESDTREFAFLDRGDDHACQLYALYRDKAVSVVDNSVFYVLPFALKSA